jgi:hypothetical protein
MTLREVVSELYPGDKFIYKNCEYLFIKTTPKDLGCSQNQDHLLLAVDLDSFEIYAFDKNWEVEVYR